MDLVARLNEHYEEMVEIRRYLHQHPELSFQEENTARYIAAYHEKLGSEVRTNVGGNGVVAILRGAKEGKTVALRADFDALPIQEENDVPYKSLVPNVMHACGHDGHTASLLVLAKVLNSFKEELSGNVVFIHQHAEELLPGGAITMIEDGCLEGVDVIFGNHLQAQIPLGEVICRSGPLQAAADFFQITIQGQGGHAAKPHLTKDSVVIAAQLILNLQQIVSRRIDPLESAVLTIGSFEGINAFNVIADKVVLKGTVRTFDQTIRSQMEKEMEKVIKGTCIANDATYTFEYKRGYPALVNHVEETEFVANVASQIAEVERVHEGKPGMGGEDFAYYLQHVKGCFFHTGAALETRDTLYPHHHPKFDIDEKALLIAAKVLGQATVQYLEQNKKVSQNGVTEQVK
jgi:amidohydrolase